MDIKAKGSVPLFLNGLDITPTTYCIDCSTSKILVAGSHTTFLQCPLKLEAAVLLVYCLCVLVND